MNMENPYAKAKRAKHPHPPDSVINIGTAVQAIEYAVFLGDGSAVDFLIDWQHGDIQGWKEYFAKLNE